MNKTRFIAISMLATFGLALLLSCSPAKANHVYKISEIVNKTVIVLDGSKLYLAKDKCLTLLGNDSVILVGSKVASKKTLVKLSSGYTCEVKFERNL